MKPKQQSLKNYIISLAVGQAHENTSLALLEVEMARDYDKAQTACQVRHLKRYPLATGYTDIIADTIKVADDLKEQIKWQAGAELIIEATSVGKPVVDLFKSEEEKGKLQVSKLEALLVVAGEIESNDYADGVRYRRVPKRNLASVLQVLLQTSRLKIAPQLEYAATLTSELANFKVKVNTAATVDMLDPWREGANDDLVFFVAAGCWSALDYRPPQRCAVSHSIFTYDY